MTTALAESALPYEEVPYESEAEWHAIRAAGIGASESAGALGFSEWGSAYRTFALKRGLIEPDDLSGKIEVQVGNATEPGIATWFEYDTGIKLRALQHREGARVHGVVLRHREYPWLLANPDRLAVEVDAVVECKSCGLINPAAVHEEEWGEPGTDQIPERYLIQVQQQLAVTGRSRWYLPVFFGGRPPAWYVGERDDVLIARMIKRLGVLWNEHILTGDPPEIVTHADARLRFPLATTKRKVFATPEIVDARAEAASLARQIEQLADRKQRVEARLMAYMADATELVDGNRWLARWPQVRALDGDRAREAYPEQFAAAHKPVFDAALFKKLVGAKPYEALLKPDTRRFTLNKELT